MAAALVFDAAPRMDTAMKTHAADVARDIGPGLLPNCPAKARLRCWTRGRGTGVSSGPIAASA